MQTGLRKVGATLHSLTCELSIVLFQRSGFLPGLFGQKMSWQECFDNPGERTAMFQQS